MPRSWLRRRSTAQFTGITLVFLPVALWVVLTAHAAQPPGPAPSLSTPGSVVTTTPAEPPAWTPAPAQTIAATADAP